METLNLKRILVLTSDMGFGHRSAAKAIHDALLMEYGDNVAVTIVNPMDHGKVPSFYRDNPEAYDLLVKRLPDLYNLTYKAVDLPFTAPLVENVNTAMLLEAMLEIFSEVQPHVVVVTRENYLSTLWAIRTITRKRVPIVTVITDLGTVHRVWFNTVSTLTCVPNQHVYDMGIAEKIPPSQLKITGIPVHPRISAETRDKREIRQSLGWQPDLKTALLVGSTRSRGLVDTVRVLNHCNFPIQLAIVTGGDDTTYAQLEAMEWHVPTHLYNFVDNMPQLLRASDMLGCKAGGLIITEGLAVGLPLLLFDAIEGQETGNIDYVVENGAGVFMGPSLDLLEAMHDWFSEDFALLNTLATRAQQLGFPRSSFEIAHKVYSYATGESLVPLSRGAVRVRHARLRVQELRDWFSKLFNDMSL